MAIQIGDVFGDYRVTGVLGRGGMGKVFRVRSLLTEREEAMKVALADVDDDPALADRFLREIKVHASLLHPNIAALRTALRIEGRLVMIMELVEGSSLEDLVRAGPMAWSNAASIVSQVLSALAFAHDRGVIHRDIKPANVLIAHGGEVKLTDFGIARATGGVRLTGTGFALGTLAYMSPEQIRAGAVDARSDIYSLGLTFYEMVTGRRAMQAETEHALMNAQLGVTPPEPSSVNPQVPPAISAAIMRALRKDPAQRFATAREFAAALPESVTAPMPVPVPPPAAGGPPAVELAELESRLLRVLGPIARRMVPDAARRYGTISEIRRALAEQIPDPKERAAFLATGAVTAPMTATRTQTAPTVPAAIDAAILERFARELAPFLGPIARVVVNRAARTARSPEELVQSLATEIDSPDDRRRFVAAARSAL